ncbi:hypothetical protein V1520DRAFT_347577 [Lipomyces starkeyi]|uniref:CENP-V/GFA domain-containing protein n=1 Tax=Lipomyces starkeyi NRRL Y-11557 TaxID=675824 RepID=A0A1E3Q5D5_LIPST|nr:hypothetical protein LIPSTDRAFT_71868 [Lipomyces starkeyi NRRL Y-11557]
MSGYALNHYNLGDMSLRLECHPISIAKSSLPVPVHLCHCDTSRHVSGILCSSYVPIPDAPFPVTSLTQHHSSPEVTRYFCSTCGCNPCSLRSVGRSRRLTDWRLPQGLWRRRTELCRGLAISGSEIRLMGA